MEGLDHAIISGLQARGLAAAGIAALPAGGGWIMAEFGGDTPTQAVEQARAVMAHFAGRADSPSIALLEGAKEQERVWSIRETGASATALALDPSEPNPVVGWEDAAVDPSQLGAYLREFDALIRKHGYQTSLYGHFGDGCIHARITFDLATAPGIAVWRKFLEEAAHLVVKYRGSLSGEHGDGQAKAEFLPVMYGEKLMQAFREFKAIWDPQGKMNPGKLIDAYRADENLRLGPEHKPRRPATVFAYRQDNNSFNHAVERCIGMGKCRAGLNNDAGATMCPSYRASGEERYSTRGRSRLLFEMLRGEVITDGWQSEEVKEALDSCLACKGCKSDCPTHVDMATWKAEFLSHYHETRARPRQAYSMGMIGRWAPLAAKLPWLANFFTQTPGLNVVAKSVAGIAQARSLPRLAPKTFREGFAKDTGGQGTREVILWTDTFNNHFRPATLAAAQAVLQHAGCRVTLPPTGLCCGRPLYDFGLLDTARAQLLAILDALAPQIEAGVPVIGLEPSCLAVFRDELGNLLPDDPRAAKLAKSSFTLAEYLDNIGYTPPQMNAQVLMQGHCHQKAVLGMPPTEKLLAAMGVRVLQPESGCCGMAGGFGFNPAHVGMSMAIGERALLPAVRVAGDETVLLADGFSCREQIEQGTGRQTQHLAEVILAALQAVER
jgi:Fe-S oxidoreductase